MTVTDAALREASSHNDELIDAELIRKWLACGLGWLLFFPTIGAFISTADKIALASGVSALSIANTYTYRGVRCV